MHIHRAPQSGYLACTHIIFTQWSSENPWIKFEKTSSWETTTFDDILTTLYSETLLMLLWQTTVASVWKQLDESWVTTLVYDVLYYLLLILQSRSDSIQDSPVVWWHGCSHGGKVPFIHQALNVKHQRIIVREWNLQASPIPFVLGPPFLPSPFFGHRRGAGLGNRLCHCFVLPSLLWSNVTEMVINILSKQLRQMQMDIGDAQRPPFEKAKFVQVSLNPSQVTGSLFCGRGWWRGGWLRRRWWWWWWRQLWLFNVLWWEDLFVKHLSKHLYVERVETLMVWMHAATQPSSLTPGNSGWEGQQLPQMLLWSHCGTPDENKTKNLLVLQFYIVTMWHRSD